MGQVIISPNIKKESARINVQGDEINPKTKEVLVPKEKEYVPTPEDLKKTVRPEVPQPVKDNPLAEMIKKQVNAAVQEAIKDIDISKMVSDAIKEAFKS